MHPLTETLKEWTDLDVATVELARLLGIVRSAAPAKDFKWVYWEENHYSETLHHLLMKMVESGLLEYDEAHLKIRTSWSAEIYTH